MKLVNYLAAMFTIGTVLVWAQAPPSTPPSDALQLLTRVSARYKDAKSYYVEMTEEVTSTGEYSREWNKTLVTAAEAPGGRYYYKGTNLEGNTLKVSDGKSVWTYRINANKYTLKDVNLPKDPNRLADFSEFSLTMAENLRNRWADVTKSLNSAERLPDATPQIGGQPVPCALVRIQSSDAKRPDPNYTFDKTIWIDKAHEVVIKVTEHARTYIETSSANVPLDRDTTITFTRVELDQPARDDLFKFVPPPGAILVADFPDPAHTFGASLEGSQVPAAIFKSPDGKTVSIDTFRGKPVLIDFWATWCGPCTSALPQLARLYGQATDKGLVVISVDRDESPDAGRKYLAAKGYTWPNYHDDGAIEKLFGPSGIPREVLVDANGRIVYDGTSDDERIRTKIAALSADFAFLTPGPQPAPCVASK